MNSEWEDKYENSMKEYLDELSIECANEMNEYGVNYTDNQFLNLLVKRVEVKFMKSVKSSLRASSKAIMSNDTNTKAVSFQNYQLID